MSRIRSRDTSPERIVRSAVHRMGFRFQLKTGNRILGKPDIVLPKYRTVIFVHGCFWHRHKGCKYAYTPKSRVDFWQAKFKANMERDARVVEELRRKGWNILIVWECQIRNLRAFENRLAKIKSRHGT